MSYKMKTRKEYSNYHVAVEVDTELFIWQKDPTEAHKVKVQRLENAAASIRRHVDDLEGVAVHYDVKNVCVYCGETEDNAVDTNTGEVCCCPQAQAEWEETR